VYVWSFYSATDSTLDSGQSPRPSIPFACADSITHPLAPHLSPGESAHPKEARSGTRARRRHRRILLVLPANGSEKHSSAMPTKKPQPPPPISSPTGRSRKSLARSRAAPPGHEGRQKAHWAAESRHLFEHRVERLIWLRATTPTMNLVRLSRMPPIAPGRTSRISSETGQRGISKIIRHSCPHC
jgi:hypothetical protein